VLTGPPGQDELDYDPLNQRVYIGNTASDFAVTVVDVKNNRVLGSIPMSAAPEQPRFNPADGMIYVNSPDAATVFVIDPQQGPFGTIVNGLKVPAGCCNAIDIDPVSNTAFLGGSGATQQILDLKSGAVVTSFPLTGTDIGMFNPHNRRWYMASDNRSTAAGTTFPCTSASDKRTYMVAVYSNSPTANSLLGVQCTGRGHAVAGVDTLNNNIYVPQVQFPADPNSADTGRPGILVYHDPAPDVLGIPAGTVQSWTTAALATTGGSGVTGTVAISLRRRSMFVDAGLNGLPANSTSTFLVVNTTAGNETINCGVNASGQGFCQGDLIGDPLIGGWVNVGSGGNRVAAGTLTSVATFPTFIPTD
jgi:YVTN family beta-propeller protein